MPTADKIAVANHATAEHFDAPLVMGITGTNPTTGSPQSQLTMYSSTSVAAALAVLPCPTDDAPRVIRQFTSVFLVSSSGELWRVYDADTLAAADRQMPSRSSELPYRVFIALSRKSQVRIHTFLRGDQRETDPVSLQEQLERSKLGVS